MRVLVVSFLLILSSACGSDSSGPGNPSRLVAGARYDYTAEYTPPGEAPVTRAGQLYIAQLGSRSLSGTWTVRGYLPEASGMVRSVSGLFGLESRLMLVARWENGRIEHYVDKTDESFSSCAYYPDASPREIVLPCHFTLTRQ